MKKTRKVKKPVVHFYDVENGMTTCGLDCFGIEQEWEINSKGVFSTDDFDEAIQHTVDMDFVTCEECQGANDA